MCVCLTVFVREFVFYYELTETSLVTHEDFCTSNS